MVLKAMGPDEIIQGMRISVLKQNRDLRPECYGVIKRARVLELHRPEFSVIFLML